MKNWNKNINIPNALSALRIVLIVPFVIFFMQNKIALAAAMIIISGLSDMFDGMIARKFNQFTQLGQMLDPFADKLTQGTVAVCLAIKQPLLIPVLAIFVFKELSMITAGCLLIKRKKKPCGAKWFGKVATGMFYISVTIIVALNGIWHYENDALTISMLSVTAAFMIYAFIKYFMIFLKIWNSDDPEDNLDLQLSQKRESKS
jgi:cardiolipin synthase